MKFVGPIAVYLVDDVGALPGGRKLIFLWLLLQAQHQVADIELASPDLPALTLAQLLLVHNHAFKGNQSGLLFGVDVILSGLLDGFFVVLPDAWGIKLHI